jgi:hypothetical protein
MKPKEWMDDNDQGDHSPNLDSQNLGSVDVKLEDLSISEKSTSGVSAVFPSDQITNLSLSTYPVENIPVTPQIQLPPTMVGEPVPIFTQAYLRTPNYTPHWIYCSELENSISLVIVNKNTVKLYILFYF